MDTDDFRAIVETTGFDVWAFIDAAIEVAAADGIDELRKRRDSIVQKLYAVEEEKKRCRNCGVDTDELFDEEAKRILKIKAFLESSELDEESLVEVLQSLADMDITFKALKETDIGKNVNKLRKHPSNDVRRLVKQLVRKWKEIVDEWVSTNQPGEVRTSALMDGDSPQQKLPQNGHQQVPDFGYSPNPQNGSSGSDRNNSESERKPEPVLRKEVPMRQKQQSPAPAYTPNVQRQREQKEQRDNATDSDRLASARKRLQENYKEVENAKKQRTIQVMDIHEIPKSKNGVVKRGGGSMGRHW